MDPKQFRQIIKEEVTDIVQTQLEPVKKDIRGIHETLQDHTKRLGTLEGKLGTLEENLEKVDKKLVRVEDKVDALSGDVEQLHLDVKGIRDKEGLFHSRNKREIDEIKTHLGLPLMSDAP